MARKAIEHADESDVYASNAKDAPMISLHDDVYGGDDVDAAVAMATEAAKELSNNGDGAGMPTVHGPRTLTWWRVMALVVVYTCIGPGAVEEVVAAGGPILGLVGLLAVPIVFVLPQIVIVAEMGAMMPTSAGNVVWVRRAFGDVAGFYNAWVFASTNMVDMAAYPVLFGDYAASTIFGDDASYGERMGFRIAGLILSALVSLLSAKAVSTFSGIGTLVLVAFVAVFFFAATPHMDPPTQINYVEDPVDWSLLFSSLLWMYGGWVCIGPLAGEVKTPKALLHGTVAAVGVDTILYLMTLFAAVAKATRGKWRDGYTVQLFNELLPGVGPFFGAGMCVTALALSVSALLCYSRTLWGIAKMGWAPNVLTKELRWGAPHVSVLVHSIVCFGLIWFDFGFIVQVEYSVIGAGLILTFCAFLKLRYSEPDAPRPYMVPGGMPFAWFITIIKVVIMAATTITALVSDWRVTVAFAAVNAAIFIAFLVHRRLSARQRGAVDPDEYPDAAYSAHVPSSD